MSATFELGYHPLEYMPCIVQPIPLSSPQQQQQQPTPQEHIDQEKKDQLIQAATSRLRHKLLEHKYQKLMSDIVEIQSKLDIVKLEASISLQSMNNHNFHLDHFEKRLENHKQQLQSIIMASITSSSSPSPSPYPKTDMLALNHRRSISSSLSSFSSTISSVLSSFTEKDVEEGETEPEDYFAILGHGRSSSSSSLKKRRKRQKMMMTTTTSYDADSYASSSSDHSHDSNPLVTDNNNITPITSNVNSSVATSCCCSSNVDDDSSDVSTPYHGNNVNVKNKVVAAPEIGRKGLLVLHSIHHPQEKNNNGLIKQDNIEERNALDDTLSFLNDLASDSDDGGFREDIIQLLDTMHNNNHCHYSPLPCRSISSSFSAAPQYNNIFRPPPPAAAAPAAAAVPFVYSCNHHRRRLSRGFLKSTFYSMLNTSWKWIRFALVLTLAILINLRRGPSF